MSTWGGNPVKNDFDDSDGENARGNEKEAAPEGKTIIDDPVKFNRKYVSEFSPRSKHAMKELGVVAKEISFKSEAFFERALEKDMPHEIAEERFKHDRKMKESIIDGVKRKRNQLVRQHWMPTIKGMKRSQSTGDLSRRSVRTTRSMGSEFSSLEIDDQLLENADNVKDEFRVHREAKAIEGLFLNEIRLLRAQKKKLADIKHMNNASNLREKKLRHTARSAKESYEQKSRRVRMNLAERKKKQEEEDHRREHEAKARMIDLHRFSEKMKKEERQAAHTRNKIMVDFENRLAKIENMESSEAEKTQKLKKLSLYLDTKNEVIGEEIQKLEALQKSSSQRAMRTMLSEQLGLWKEFQKRFEWTQKKFNSSIVECEHRAAYLKALREKHAAAQKQAAEELQRRRERARDEEAKRRRKVDAKLQKMKEEKTQREKEFRTRILAEEKRLLDRKNKMAQLAKGNAQARSMKMKEVQEKMKAEQQERIERIKEKEQQLEQMHEEQQRKRDKEALIARERRRLLAEEKSIKLSQLQRSQAYQKEQTLKRNQNKIKRGKFLSAYRQKQVSERKAKAIDHKMKREGLQSTFHRMRRTKAAEIGSDDCLKHLVKLAATSLEDQNFNSFMKQLESSGFNTEFAHDVKRRTMRKSQSTGRL